MKYLFLFLFLLLVLTACTTPKAEAKRERKEPNPHLNKVSIDKEVIKDWDREPNQYVDTVKLRHIPLSDPSILPRLVRVQDNFAEFWKFCQNRTNAYSHAPEYFQLKDPEAILGYGEIFMDPKTTNYYAGLLYPAGEVRVQNLPALTPVDYSNAKRLVLITNLSPSERLLADTANSNTLYIQKIMYIADFYRGAITMPHYLYLDPENKVQLKVLPITNQENGYVAYKGISPNSGRVFYAGRVSGFQMRSEDDKDDSYHNTIFGELNQLRGTIEGIWEAMIPPEEPSDD